MKILRGLFGSRDRGESDFKKRLIEAKVRLQETANKIDEALNKLKHRDVQLFSNAVKALASGDEVKASIYAGEIAEIRKIMKTLTTIKYAIERVSIRLDTIETLEDVGITLIPLIPVIRSVRDQVSQLIPEVASNLDEVLNSMQEVISVSTNMPERTMVPMTMSPDAQSILEEARKRAELELRIEESIRLPEFERVKSYVDKVNKKIQEKLREERVTAPPRIPQAVAVVVPRRPSFDEVKQAVLDYIRSHRGFLDVTDCARRLGVSSSDVRKALEALINEGKIRVIG